MRKIAESLTEVLLERIEVLLERIVDGVQAPSG